MALNLEITIFKLITA